MNNQLRIRVAKNPNPDAALSMRQVRPSRRLLRSVFGTAKPRQKMAILLPGVDTAAVEVAVEETDGDVTALAEALGVLDGGDAK